MWQPSERRTAAISRPLRVPSAHSRTHFSAFKNKSMLQRTCRCGVLTLSVVTVRDRDGEWVDGISAGGWSGRPQTRSSWTRSVSSDWLGHLPYRSTAEARLCGQETTGPTLCRKPIDVTEARWRGAGNHLHPQHPTLRPCPPSPPPHLLRSQRRAQTAAENATYRRRHRPAEHAASSLHASPNRGAQRGRGRRAAAEGRRKRRQARSPAAKRSEAAVRLLRCLGGRSRTAASVIPFPILTLKICGTCRHQVRAVIGCMTRELS